MAPKPQNKAELLAAYPETAWREKFIDLTDLVAFLRGCIIRADYKVSDRLNGSIIPHLSLAGKKIRDSLVTKEDVSAKEANVLALLGLVHIDPLVDVAGIDLEALREAIEAEVLADALRFPFVYGRQLYDRAAEIFKEERDYLKHDETLRLLEGTLPGVFQSGRYIVGPFGIWIADERRDRGPTTSIPLQHCSDPSCGIIHDIQLSTSFEASINQSRRSLNKVLDAVSIYPSEWNEFMDEIRKAEGDRFSISDDETIVEFLGDCVALDELRGLLSIAVKCTEGRIAARLKSVAPRQRIDEIVVGLNHSQMLQILLTEKDETLRDLVEEAIRTSVIEIPLGEIRRPRVNSGVRHGAWRLQSQASCFGLRSVGASAGLPQLRLGALARNLFDTTVAGEADEMAWALKRSRGATAQEKMEAFLRDSDPRDVIRDLVLARRSLVGGSLMIIMLTVRSLPTGPPRLRCSLLNV